MELNVLTTYPRANRASADLRLGHSRNPNQLAILAGNMYNDQGGL